MAKIPQITCNKCKGTGLIKLRKTYVPVLNVLRRLKKCSAPEIHKHLSTKTNISNTNNKLEELRKLGFIDRKRSKEANAWIYYPI